MEKNGCYREVVVVEKMTGKVLLYTYYSYSVSNHKGSYNKKDKPGPKRLYFSVFIL